jgi:hypothetical protein
MHRRGQRCARGGAQRPEAHGRVVRQGSSTLYRKQYRNRQEFQLTVLVSLAYFLTFYVKVFKLQRFYHFIVRYK